MLNKIYFGDKKIYRLLDIADGQFLVIDCIKRTMPMYVDYTFLSDMEESTDEERLLRELKVELPSINSLSPTQLKTMHLRFASISYCLTNIVNEVDRRLMTYFASLDYKVSIQTIRHRLCDYLVFQNITALAPKQKKVKELTNDEKNFRWALNKYFYNSKKLSLRQAYKYLISEKYCNNSEIIVKNYPKFHQFKYFYYKTRSESNFIISRMGRGEYDRNFRPLLGEGVRDFCPTIGYGMIDSTTCDIYLVNDDGELIGRPIFTACIDAYSSMCLGYSLGWEGGINSVRKLINNVVSNKVDLCKRYGIDIKEEEWNCHWIPHKLITDKGKEFAGDTFEQLTDLGVEIVNLEPFRPELKSLVERFFGLIQESFKKELINKGVVLKDFGDRGAIDYRKNACITLEQFEKVIILCILHYNCGRAIELPYDKKDIKGHAKDLWNSCFSSFKDMLIEANEELVKLVLLPRRKAIFKRDGLAVNKLRYRAIGFTDDYLSGKEVVVAYDPNNVSRVWLISKGNYIEFELIDSFFMDMDLITVEKYKNKKDIFDISKEQLISEIELSKQIELIGKQSIKTKPVIKNIKANKKKELKRIRKA